MKDKESLQEEQNGSRGCAGTASCAIMQVQSLWNKLKELMFWLQMQKYTTIGITTMVG